jgi:V8-like Glu-specific endopeptidase
VSHITGTVQTVSPVIVIGPDSGAAPSPPNVWAHNFAHTPAPSGTKLLILHFHNASFPANNRLEVDLGYDTDVFHAADGTDFWTRPVNLHAFAGGLVPIRYITDGASTGSVQLDKYGRGERHAGEPGRPSFSNCDPFLGDPIYTEPTYDPFWFCSGSPNWENAACVTTAADARARVARSVGMIVSVETSPFTGIVQLSTCSVTLVDADKVITAGHCHTPDEALTSSVTFDYQTDCPGARPPGYNARFFKVKQVLNHRYDSGGDYSLLQLATAPAGIPAIQMRHDIPAAGEQVFGIHHPNGAVKKLSIPHPGFDTVQSSDSGAVTVPSNFHVSGGSSGSGLFDTAGRIVGVLSNGNPCAGGPALTYFPTSTILGQIVPAPPPPITRDVMVVIDRSGSMSLDDGTGRTKIEAARDAVSLFVQLVRVGTGNRVGLVSFSTTASTPVDFGIAPATLPNRTMLIGPAPFSGGVVGGLAPGGSTTIGGGLDAARLQFPAPGANPRAILLLTDGLQNTPPMVNAVEGLVSGIDVDAIGFGTESSLDGALLTQLAAAHNGSYTRAGSGLALEKFFTHAFGSIFEAGVLMDPEFFLPHAQDTGEKVPFHVCEEETITVVVGWDRADGALRVEVTTPGGVTVNGSSAGVEESIGRTWTFLRIPLPQGGERDGVWTATVFRPRGDVEFPASAPDLHYFVNIVAGGGPVLERWPDSGKYYTGDAINPLVQLRFPTGGFPPNAKVQVTVTRPNASAGNLLSKAKLREPITIDADTVPARQATLLALERESGRPAVVYTEETFDLFGDAAHTNGAFESAGLFGNPLTDLLTVEGNYTFHFRATYGDDCTGTRELMGSLHVDVGIDPSRTVVSTSVGATRPDGSREVTATFIPRDRYGNNLGPGRLDGLSVSGADGTTITGPVQDNGDGSYTVPAVWDPSASGGPGVVVGQPGRPPRVLQEPSRAAARECWKWKLLCGALLILALILLLLLILR